MIEGEDRTGYFIHEGKVRELIQKWRKTLATFCRRLLDQKVEDSGVIGTCTKLTTEVENMTYQLLTKSDCQERNDLLSEIRQKVLDSFTDGSLKSEQWDSVLRKEFDELQSQLNEIKEKPILTEEQARYNRCVNRLREEERTKQQLTDAKKRCEEISQQRMIDIRKLKDQVKGIEKLQKQLEDALKDKKDLEKKFREATQKNKELQGEVQDLKAALEDALTKEEEHKGELDKTNSYWKGLLKRSEDEKDELRKKLEELQKPEDHNSNEDMDPAMLEALGLVPQAETPGDDRSDKREEENKEDEKEEGDEEAGKEENEESGKEEDTSSSSEHPE